MDHQAQPSDRSAVLDYDVRVIVAGSRLYNNYNEFFPLMDEFYEMLLLKYPGKKIVFVTGKASRGPDDMIIRWCKHYNRPWVEFAANWDEHGKRAGFIRNDEMGEVGTDCIVFWDGLTKGSAHMYRTAMAKGLYVVSVLINLDKEPTHGKESQSC